MRLGVDTGGTFTDIVTVGDDGRLTVAKVPSSEAGDPSGILKGIQTTLDTMASVDIFIHGTTMVTNAIIERKGAVCGLVGTDGFRDLLEIRRAHRAREGILNINWDPPPPLVPRRLRLTVRERVNYRGDIELPLNEDDVRAALERFKANSVTAIAVCLLNSFKNPVHEQRIAELIAEEMPEAYVTLSHIVAPVVQEFERTATVVGNAFVGPLMDSYLSGLSLGCKNLGLRNDLLLMQSHGGVMSPQFARQSPARAARSGPVAGVIAAAQVGSQIDRHDLVSFDMGGTSCDIAVIRDGLPIITEESEVEFGLPMLFPSVLIDTIGAGGGSVAWVDATGRLRSGPHSAGAHPGPACYGRGGTEPTTTDAHLVLGTLAPTSLLAGQMALDIHAARAAIGKIATQLGEDLLPTAAGIVRVANSLMEQGVRRMTLEQGHDPRDLTLVAFGGAGPLHAAAIARAMHIPEVIVPAHPGLTSALGLLYADLRHDHIATFGVAVPLVDPAHIEAALRDGDRSVREKLAIEGVASQDIGIEYTLNLKYAGGIEPQALPVHVSFDGSVTGDWLEKVSAQFHLVHQRLRNYSVPTYPVEIESVRVEGIGRVRTAEIRQPDPAAAAAPSKRSALVPSGMQPLELSIYDRPALASGAVVHGPAVIEQFDATTLIEPGMVARVDAFGNIRIDTGGA